MLHACLSLTLFPSSPLPLSSLLSSTFYFVNVTFDGVKTEHLSFSCSTLNIFQEYSCFKATPNHDFCVCYNVISPGYQNFFIAFHFNGCGVVVFFNVPTGNGPCLTNMCSCGDTLHSELLIQCVAVETRCIQNS